MFSDDEEEIPGPPDPTVEELLRDYDALLRKKGAGPAYLKRRLRQMGISERKIMTCHTRTELIELILFAEIPAPSPPTAPPLAVVPDAVWAVLLFIIGMYACN